MFHGEPYVAVGIPAYKRVPFIRPEREGEVANFRKNSLIKLEACIGFLFFIYFGFLNFSF
jgi:hypothetical protein